VNRTNTYRRSLHIRVATCPSGSYYLTHLSCTSSSIVQGNWDSHLPHQRRPEPPLACLLLDLLVFISGCRQSRRLPERCHRHRHPTTNGNGAHRVCVGPRLKQINWAGVDRSTGSGSATSPHTQATSDELRLSYPQAGDFSGLSAGFTSHSPLFNLGRYRRALFVDDQHNNGGDAQAMDSPALS
jgi:hypothetical protein